MIRTEHCLMKYGRERLMESLQRSCCISARPGTRLQHVPHFPSVGVTFLAFAKWQNPSIHLVHPTQLTHQRQYVLKHIWIVCLRLHKVRLHDALMRTPPQVRVMRIVKP